ncbi:hypothetical protein [Blastococcus saxobsidens]|nr:hypothetical protein [Blastococcus saxobsidens]
MDSSEIAVAFASSLAGAVAGAVLPLFLPKRTASSSTSAEGSARNAISGGTFTGNVHVGDEVFHLTHDNRVIINGPAVREVADLTPPRRERRPSNSAASTSSSSDWEPLVWGGLAVLLVVLGYLRYRETVIITVLSLSGFAMFLPIGALIAARVRAVSYARSQLVQVWLNLLLVCASLLGIYFLSDPLTGIDASVFATLLEAGRTAAIDELFERFGFDWVLFLLYQLLGLALSVLSVSMIAFHSLKLYAVAATAVRAQQDGDYRPGPMRAWLIRVGGGPGAIFGKAVVLTVFSLVLISGAGFALVSKLQSDRDFPGIPAPATPTAPSEGDLPAPPS